MPDAMESKKVRQGYVSRDGEEEGSIVIEEAIAYPAHWNDLNFYFARLCNKRDNARWKVKRVTYL